MKNHTSETRLFLQFIILCLGAFTGFQINSANAEDGIGSLYHWRASNSVIETLPEEIERLIYVLYNNDMLPVRTIRVDETKARSVEDIFLSSFPAIAWTDRLDNVLCDLNSRLCDRPRSSAFAKSSTLPAPDIRGNAVTSRKYSQWREMRGAYVTIPDINLRHRANWNPFTINRGRSGSFEIKNTYDRYAIGCSSEKIYDSPFLPHVSFDQLKQQMLATDALINCAAVIANYHLDAWIRVASSSSKAGAGDTGAAYGNVLKLLERIGAGSNLEAWAILDGALGEIYLDNDVRSIRVWLPVASVFCEFRPPVNSHEAINGSPSPPTSHAWRERYSRLGESERYALVERELVTLSKVDDRSSNDFTPDTGTVTNLASSDIYKKSAFAFKAVNFVPLATGEETFPELPTEIPHSIVVIDDGVDAHHCVFAGDCNAVWVQTDELQSPGGPQAVMFDAIKAELAAMEATGKYHGLGVASVLAARAASGVIQGIDPAASVFSVDMSLKRWNSTRLPDMAQQLVQEHPGVYTVWNLSGHTLDRAEAKPVFQFLKSQPGADTQMLVVAAGNVPTALLDDHISTRECLVYPACTIEAYPNLIAVVGARIGDDGIPELWTDRAKSISSYGNPMFQIAGIAEGVVVPSATTSGFFAMNGTSYAAPQVAAVVSRLHAQMRHRPENIVARLIACGLQSSKLEPYVAGGLLDVGCSLLAQKAQIAFEPSDEQGIDASVAKKLRPGTILGIWRDGGEKADVVDIGKGEDYKITGFHQWWAKPGFPSFLGIRRLAGEDDRFKLVVWDREKKIQTEVRDKLRSTHTIEIKFDGDSKPTCIPVSSLLDFIPAADTFVDVGGHINASKSTCGQANH